MSAAAECRGLLCLSVARRWEEGSLILITDCDGFLKKLMLRKQDVYYSCLVEFAHTSVSCEIQHIGYKAVVTLELSLFHILDVAFQKYLCDVSGR
ncbi:hypothetical protein T4B_2424 [Trichinella pseudospiralis]|uniref:Uncharacterized protein n=1 Tax=Trichinella pseudospiralis TaxID=6337 RepID=A0A0V1GP73_TRIPS|nr:hypothetical protein T4B_2424 [Trichinella pseudospiralis]